MYDISRRGLEWMYNTEGGDSGAWHEEIPLIRPSMKTAGLIPWTTAEMTYFIVRHVLGFAFDGNGNLCLSPGIFQQTTGLKARIRYRDSFISYSVEGTGKPVSAIVNGKKYKIGQNGKIKLGDDFNGGEIVIRLK